MKKTLILIFISLTALFIGCSPESDNPVVFAPAAYTNHYALSEIKAKVIKHHITNEDYIVVYLYGEIVSDNVFFSSIEENPYTDPVEQQYFINKVADIEVTANKPYRNNTKEIQSSLFFSRREHSLLFKDVTCEEEIGYSPISIYFNEPPDSSQWFIFKIKITDDMNNVFISETDSAYIQK